MQRRSSPHSRPSQTPACSRSTVAWSIARISFRRGAFWIEHPMAEPVHPVPASFDARIGPDELADLRRRAAEETDAFWLDQARRLDWHKAPSVAGRCDFSEDDFCIQWYADGQLNLSVNCLDRHL